jgi:hypothetical protein
MALLTRFGSLGVLCALFALATSGCGGEDPVDDDDDGGGGSSSGGSSGGGSSGGGSSGTGGGGTRWKCFDDTMYDQCDCQSLGPNEDWINETKGAVEVARCPAYELCVTYYDTFFEVNGCSCGASDLMPFDATNVMPVGSCPP